MSSMQKLILAILVTLSATAVAQSASLKPGLWEINLIRQVVDGRDMAAQMAAARAQMQQAMAGLPPEQRKQMEKMMSRGGTSPLAMAAGGGTRICVSAAVAARDTPMVDPKGHCEPAKVNRSGNKTNFEFNCAANGRTSVGKGESTINGDTVVTRVDMTVTDARGSHTMQNEMEMKYLGADCQGIKPAGELAKEGSPQNSESKAHLP
ncbi:MAG: DUF3617 domain-containing protein [Methylovirgula sp.]